MSFDRRHPVVSYLVLAFVIVWVTWIPVLIFGAPPRPFSAVGAILGLAFPAFLVTAARDGRAGVRDLLRRTLRWRVGIGWYVLAMLAIPVGALLPPCFSARRRSDDCCRTGLCCSPNSSRSCC
jgi:hypothetical protein